jgi:hypothetical protein
MLLMQRNSTFETTNPCKDAAALQDISMQRGCPKVHLPGYD